MATGDIGAALIDSLQILNTCSAVVNGDVVHVQDFWFAVVYHEDSTTDTILATFEIDICGNISCVTDTIVVDTGGSGARPRATMVKRTDGVVVVGYGTTSGPFFKSFSVDTCGNITLVDTQDMGAGSPVDVWINTTKHDDVFAMVWQPTGDLDVATATIDTSGNISTVVDTQTLNCAGCGPDLVYGSPALVWTGIGDFHAVAGEETASMDGFVVTFTIDSSGNIGTVTDRLEFDTANGEQASINSNDNGILIILSEGSGGGGDITTVTVDACGNMTAADDETAMSFASSDRRSRLLRIDEIGNKNIFLGLTNTNFESWSFDACGNLTQIDTLSGILEAQLYVGMNFLPASGNIVVGCGYKSSTTEFFVWTLDVALNVVAAAVGVPYGLLPRQQIKLLLI